MGDPNLALERPVLVETGEAALAYLARAGVLVWERRRAVDWQADRRTTLMAAQKYYMQLGRYLGLAEAFYHAGLLRPEQYKGVTEQVMASLAPTTRP